MAAVPLAGRGGRQSVVGEVVAPRRPREATVAATLIEGAGPPRGREEEPTAGVSSGFNAVCPRGKLVHEIVGSTR